MSNDLKFNGLCYDEYAVVKQYPFLFSLSGSDIGILLIDVPYESTFIMKWSNGLPYLILLPSTNEQNYIYWLHKRVILPMNDDLTLLFQENDKNFDPLDHRMCKQIASVFKQWSVIIESAKPQLWSKLTLKIMRNDDVLYNLIDAKIKRYYAWTDGLLDTRICIGDAETTISLWDDLFLI